MKLSGNNDNSNRFTPQMFTAVMGVTCVVLFIMVIVLTSNKDNRKSSYQSNYQSAQNQHSQSAEKGNEEITLGTLTPADLDFWDKYPEKKKVTSAETTLLPVEDTTVSSTDTSSQNTDKKEPTKTTLVDANSVEGANGTGTDGSTSANSSTGTNAGTNAGTNPTDGTTAGTGTGSQNGNGTNAGTNTNTSANGTATPGTVSGNSISTQGTNNNVNTQKPSTGAAGTAGGGSVDEAANGVLASDVATDGKHTLVTLRDGTTEWVTISKYISRHDYDFANLVSRSDRMEYYVDGVKTSFVGIDISRYNGSVDYNQVKNDGVDFVMVRLGARGYGSGTIVEDVAYDATIENAMEAGLEIGAYFSSQAITVEEAEEEAQLVIDLLSEYQVTYPVVFDMEFANNDKARIDKLTKSEKTTIAKSFLDKVSAAGYIGMIYGNKEWLLKEVDMTKLTAYEVWLAQYADIPDYPYQFQMWQYKNDGEVAGVSGKVNLNISFVDYRLR